MSTVGKGSRWRHRVQEWLGAIGAVTTATRWMEPGDDIKASLGSTMLSLECKDHRSLNLAGWVDQANRNAIDPAIGIVIAHRLGKADVDNAYVIMSGHMFARLLKELG